MPDHYFTAEPTSPAERREITVTLAGHPVRVETAPGVFSSERLDPGTAVLLDHAAPPPPSGDFLDLGCGWGPLSLELALSSPGARVFAVDVNVRALDLTRRNAERLGLTNVVVATPEEATSLLGEARIDLIWSNPPIRVGKEVLHEMLRTWLGHLAPAGRAELVVARNLGADSLQRWISEFMPCERVASSRGFRVLVAQPGA
ncbi:MAG: class I SAM-dependent methyltransferase [Actinomycetota bacterium]